MRLSTFIELNLEEILGEWDKFAKTLFPTEDKFNAYLLRDHAREVLLELTADMETSQSSQEQADKSKGVATAYHPEDSAANVHGVLRHDDGFSVSQVAAEFRALRASVLRLWLPKISVMTEEVVTDIVRFNESIDEALADSLVTYKS
ncbi:MAG: hypothetical protein V4772_04025 [Pseudomonadota bacterium]